MSAHLSFARDRRQWLITLAIVLGLGELVDSFFISFWEAGVVFSALFLLAAFWTRRGGMGGPILVGALCVFELQSFPTWERTGMGDWISQIAFVVVSAVGLVVAIAVLKREYDTRKTSKASSLKRA
jgi:hypothetical protein